MVRELGTYLGQGLVLRTLSPRAGPICAVSLLSEVLMPGALLPQVFNLVFNLFYCCLSFDASSVFVVLTVPK